MKRLIAIGVCWLLGFGGSAQDTIPDSIVYPNGEVLSVSIVEVDARFVHYKRFDFQEGNPVRLPLRTLETVIWDGKQVWPKTTTTNDVVASKTEPDTLNKGLYPINPTSGQPMTDKAELYKQGMRDATEYYQPEGFMVLGFGSGLVAPIATAPLAVVSLISPSKKNMLQFQDNPRADYLAPHSTSYSADYEAGFRRIARRRKRGKIAAGFGIGLATTAALILLSTEE